MTIVITLAKSVLNFLVVNVILLVMSTQKDATYYIGALIAILAGYILRVVVEVKNGSFTWRNSGIQAVMSLCLSYLCMFMYEDIAPRFRLEYYLFACSFCSVFIVSLMDKTLKIGLKGSARLLLSKIMAEDPKTNQEEKP